MQVRAAGGLGGTGRGPPDPAGAPCELRNVALTAPGPRLWSYLVQEPGRVSSALPLRSQLAPGCRPGRTQRGTKEPQGRGHRQTRASSQRLGPWLRPGHSPPWALLPPRARGSPDPRGCGPEGHLCPQGPGPHDLRQVRDSAGGSGGGGLGSPCGAPVSPRMAVLCVGHLPASGRAVPSLHELFGPKTAARGLGFREPAGREEHRALRTLRPEWAARAGRSPGGCWERPGPEHVPARPRRWGLGTSAAGLSAPLFLWGAPPWLPRPGGGVEAGRVGCAGPQARPLALCRATRR